MANNGLVLIAFVVVLKICGGSPEEDKQDELDKHEIRVNAFKCSVPQPRAIPFEELFPTEAKIFSGSTIVPKMTVLHR